VKKLLIIALIVVVLLAGAGGAIVLKVWKGGGKTAEAAEKLPTTIVVLEERTVNLADRDTARFVRLTVALEIQGKDDVEKQAEEKKPKLFDRLIEITGRQTFKNLLTPEGKAQLKKQLVVGFTQVLQEDTSWSVTNVLFTDIIME